MTASGVRSVHSRLATRHFLEVDERACYDGIWACASLLHVPAADLPDALYRLWAALKSGGAFYLSFKLGEGERMHEGRHFTDTTEPQLRRWLGILPDLDRVECWTTSD